MTDAVCLTRVSKSFGQVAAVRDFSLAVPRGCVYGFLGPNGAGKTTLIRMVMGIFHPDAGRIEVLGASDPLAARDRVGYLPEERGLYKKMRVGELVAYFARLKGMDAHSARGRAAELLRRFGLGDRMDKRCETLSKGMAQKVQLLVTLVHTPELLILDEPFSGLDPVNTDVMRDWILQMKRQGCTTIFSTHIMEQAEKICDHVVLIDGGRKVLDGELAQVRTSGGRAIRLDYDGDGSCLAQLPGVDRVNDAGKQAELFLADGSDPQQILAALVGDQVRVRRFELSEPSLHDIFVRVVGGEADGV